MDGEVEAEPRTGRRRRLANDRIPVWFGVPFFILGSLAFVIGVFQLRDELRFGDEGTAVQGVVVRLSTHTDEDSTTYTVDYRFVDPASGTSHGGAGNVDRRAYLALGVGDSVTVTYLPSEPAKHRLGTPDLQLVPVLLVLGVGALFAITGPVVVVMSLRQRRAPSPSAPAPARPAIPGPRRETSEAELRRVDVFSRSPGRIVGELVVAPIVGIVLLAFAWWALGNLDLDPDLAVFALVAVIFAVIMFAGFMGGLRRGVSLRLLEVGPDGIWLPETGRLPWAAIAEVRLEESLGTRRRGAARRIIVAEDGTEQEASLPGTYPRVGIVPRDPVLLDRAPGGVARGVTEAIVGLAGAVQPGLGLTMSDPSPFGVTSYEIRQPISAVVESVRRFATVIDARPVHEAPPMPAPAVPAPAAAAPVTASALALPAGVLSDHDLRAIDARLGQPSAAPLARLDTATLVRPVDRSLIAGHPDGRLAAPRLFQRRNFTTSDALSLLLPGATLLPAIGRVVVLAVVGLLFIVAPSLMLLAMLGAPVGGTADGGTVVGGVVMAAVMAGVGVVALRKARRDWATAKASPEFLEVGPDGLRTRDAGLIPWARIDSVTSRNGTLEIRPTAGGERPTSLGLELFDADADEILDAIAHYRIVDEG